MKSVIIGTAGHIDHGKTALVKALTGIDADRLEEEKRRGITIDIGFANLELPAPNGDTLRLGFVDVPGHERFVRNMLAGIGGIDLVLLVIAADESIKPQTREHFDICKLLSVSRGITVITKSDLVDPETLDVVKLEVEEFLSGSFLDPQKAPIVPLSAKTGAGLDDLRNALAKIASDASTKDSKNLARLPIDRVFSMKGFGTVVTGTLISGTIHKEDEVEVLPGALTSRIRGLQVHNKPADKAIAGERTALNLTAVSAEELRRGMTVAPPSTLQVTSRLDVALTLLSSAKPIKNRTRVHFHAYTSETIATVSLLSVSSVATVTQPRTTIKSSNPNEKKIFARLRLAEPVVLIPDDRFIIRQFSPVVTIGGGVVLDALPLSRSRIGSQQKWLSVLESGEPQSILEARVARRGNAGLTIEQTIAETGWRREIVLGHLARTISAGVVLQIGDLLVHSDVVDRLKTRLQDRVSEFHKQNPLVAGISKEALRGTTAPEIFTAVVNMLVSEKKLTISGDTVHLPGRGVVMKDEEAESKKIIENAFAVTGLKVPALKDVLSGLKVDRVRAQKIMTLLLRDKVLIKISEDLVFHRDALQNLRNQLASEKKKSPKIDVSRFKDMTGVSRKYAIPLLEYLDREHVTKRVGDERVIL